MGLKESVQKLAEAGFSLRGTAIMVELLPVQELKTASGLIISAPTEHARGSSINSHKLEVAEVLLVGPGDWVVEINQYIPLDIKPGNVVVLNQYSYSLISLLPGLTEPTGNKLAVVPPQGILAIYPNMEAYKKAIGEM